MVKEKIPPKYPRQFVREASPKERRYVKNLFSKRCMTKKEAALDAGYKHIPNESPAIKSEIVKVMHKAGLSDYKLVVQLKHFLFDAKREDNALKALRMAFELKDSFPANRKTPDLSLSQINIYQGVEYGDLKKRVRDLLERIGAEESEGRPILSDDPSPGIQRPDGELPQGTVSEDTKPE